MAIRAVAQADAPAPSAEEIREEAQAGDADLPERMTMKEIIATGGVLMYVLFAMSVIGVALTLYFLMVLRENQVAPRSLVLELRLALGAGRVDEALAVCERSRSPAAAIARKALEHTRSADGDVDLALLREIIEGEGGRQATTIQNQIQYLQDIAVIAPMVGLLGTVLGMLTAFNAVALDIAKAKPMVLAAGVSQALITTAAGLIVGIPAMIAYAYFRGRAARLVSGLEALSADLLSQLMRKRGG
jgi:biopolymer transport protein ExbB